MMTGETRSSSSKSAFGKSVSLRGIRHFLVMRLGRQRLFIARNRDCHGLEPLHRTDRPNLFPLLLKFTTKDESPKNLLSKRQNFGPILLRILMKYTTSHVRTQERLYQSESEQPLFHLVF